MVLSIKSPDKALRAGASAARGNPPVRARPVRAKASGATTGSHTAKRPTAGANPRVASDRGWVRISAGVPPIVAAMLPAGRRRGLFGRSREEVLSMNDRDVVEAFVTYLRDNGNPGLRVDWRADEENRRSADIDAIAGTFAIEHTSIDTLPNQRRDSDWFKRVVGDLEEEFEAVLPFRLRIALDYDAVGIGQNWDAVRAALKSWISNESLNLPEGYSLVEKSHGIPFQLHVWKGSTRPPGLLFRRHLPDDDTLDERMTVLDRKAAKLARYQKLGFTTVLLVENDDIALMNAGKMLEAIQTSHPMGPPPGVDQVWYADTSIPDELEFLEFTSELRNSAD